MVVLLSLGIMTNCQPFGGLGKPVINPWIMPLTTNDADEMQAGLVPVKKHENENISGRAAASSSGVLCYTTAIRHQLGRR